MKDIIIDASQYSNLNITYSEKNNIDNVKGKEYKIKGTNVINFSFESGNDFVNENGKIEINYSEHTDTSGLPAYTFDNINGTQILDMFHLPTCPIYSNINVMRVNFKEEYYFRAEDYRIRGKFRAYTSEPILDINTIGVSCEISYNTYIYETNDPHDQPIVIDKMYNSNSPAFETIRKPSNQTNVYEIDGIKEVSPQTTNVKLEFKNASFKSHILGIVEDKAYYTNNKSSICQFSKPRLISTDNGITTVEVDYDISIWCGYNDVLVTQWALFDHHYLKNTLNNATSIQFTVQANGIDIADNEFKYGDGEYKEYELESNELMQYESGQPYNTRQSYITSQKMLDKTQINRMIVSFDLLKLDRVIEKIEVEATDTQEAVISYHYLDTGDLIKIKDQNDEYVGQYNDENGNIIVPYFEIISLHGIWDGTYHLELVCKQKL